MVCVISARQATWIAIAALVLSSFSSAAQAQVRSTSPPPDEPEALCIQSDGAIGWDSATTDTCEPNEEIIEIFGLSFGNTGQTVLNGSNGNVTIGGALAIVNGQNVDMGGNRVQNVATPTAASPGTDAANKEYVDQQNAAQDERITDVENRNTEQDEALADHEQRITTATQTNTAQNIAISNLEAANADIQLQVSENTADIFNLQQDVRNLEERDEELAEGIAISLALDAPVLRNGQTFAMRGGWGNFNGTNAAGVTAAGALSQNMVVDAGVGWGAARGTVAGKAGVTVGW